MAVRLARDMDGGCAHPVRLHGLCAHCGRDVSSAAGDGDASAPAAADADAGRDPRRVPILHRSAGLTVLQEVCAHAYGG